MSIEVKRKEGENIGSLLYRFNRRIKQSGILKEAKKRRFFQRPENKRKKRLGALHRVKKREEIQKLKKMGYL